MALPTDPTSVLFVSEKDVFEDGEEPDGKDSSDESKLDENSSSPSAILFTSYFGTSN